MQTGWILLYKTPIKALARPALVPAPVAVPAQYNIEFDNLS
jgi:hypothetical protein